MDAINGDKLRGHLETMILSTLEQSEAHGLEILHRLEDAGCGDAAILDHCRQPAEHVRGCWVVDLLLGKQ